MHLITESVVVEMPANPVVTAAFLVFANLFVLIASQESCKLPNGEGGVCKLLTLCPKALEQLRSQVRPNICSFADLQPVVCCSDVIEERPRRRKSEEKCLEYSRVDFVKERDEDPLITGGENAVPREFPHMAILGYGGEDNIEWKCGGSLISEQYVLTAAHCLSSEEGDVKYVRLGDLDLYNTNDEADPQQFKIAKTIPYQEYVWSSSYHDIALLKLERPVKFTEFVRPACLQTEYSFDNETLKATGWGALAFGSDLHGFLQKVNLHKFAKEDCDVTYKAGINLRQGIIDSIQICAGSFAGGRDSCQASAAIVTQYLVFRKKPRLFVCRIGTSSTTTNTFDRRFVTYYKGHFQGLGDSGGPLQKIIQNKPLMYKIVGVVSTGKYCGLVPGLYTRVSAYITWIEEIVWPN